MPNTRAPATRLCLAALLTAGAALTASADVDLVRDGKPNAVLIAAGAEPQAATAAAEIRKYVEKMSGVILPLLNEGEADATGMPVTVAVGRTKLAEANGVQIPSGFTNAAGDPKAFRDEGYAIRTRGNVIFVGGNSDGPYLGTLYAAYALLEKLGCRWYFPGEWGEVIPRRETVTVPDLDVTVRPDFIVRQIWLSGWVPTSKAETAAFAEWHVKAGFNKESFYPLAGDGFLALPLSPHQYYEQHPEFFAMDKAGSRKPRIPKRTGKFDDRETMLCLSNPAMFAEYVKNLREAFSGQKKIRAIETVGVGISPPDGAPFCYCPECVAANQGFDYPSYVAGKTQSEEYFAFCAKVAAEFPDKWVATMAYSNREMPPQGVKLPPNVSVKYAPISCCVLHPNNDPSCWRRQEMMAILKQYVRQTPHVQMRDYNPGFLTGVYLPERDMANIAVNIPIYKDVGVSGMIREGRKAFMQTWISYYLTGKLLWDSRADVAALKKDFYETFFGPAAGPHVQAWWDEYEDALGRATVHVHEDWLVNHVVTTELTAKLRRHVEAAGRAEMTEAQRKRFDAFALIAEHVEAYAAMHAADRNLDYARAAAEAQRMLDLKNRLAAIWSFFYTYHELRERNPVFTSGHIAFYQRLDAMTTGKDGRIIAPFPPRARFMRDRFNEGVVAEWYAPDFDDAAWGDKDTFLLLEQQDPPEDARGHDWNGHGWYRATVDMPPAPAGRSVRLFCGGAINEAWVWVNGRYAGHKPHKLWWGRNQEIDLDVTPLVKPGRNVIAIRVWNDADVGGLYRRGFLWSPNP
jgi:hypothetical protein